MRGVRVTERCCYEARRRRYAMGAGHGPHRRGATPGYGFDLGRSVRARSRGWAVDLAFALVGIGTALLFFGWFFRMTGEWNVRASDRRIPEPLDFDPHTGESAAPLDDLPFPLIRCPA